MNGVFLNGVTVQSLAMVENKLVQWNAEPFWLITRSTLRSVPRRNLRPNKIAMTSRAQRSGLWVTGRRWVIFILLLLLQMLLYYIFP